MMLLPKLVRERCPAHLEWVRGLPCAVCHPQFIATAGMGSGPRISCAHHLTTAQPKARGLKAGDQWAVPLCVFHHDAQSGPEAVHNAGNEMKWWHRRDIDPLLLAAHLWDISVAEGRVQPKQSKRKK